ncbi:Hydrogenase maturation factor [Cetobacterium ceti]|uniref:Hydrogenase maturation factor n=1 Tax=Cetobacterium ceti TaxID=180163 RepID=A0A1T4JWA7_9FUSO|nr:AIR synthase family protein [Cetobacterium ceti]SJZ34456.1 Hydrogenase maturation factor [Cetobacterium ceti]
MKIGKLTVTDLENLIFKKLDNNRDDVLALPEIGGDCAAIDLGDKIAYLSTDPITGSNNGIGKLAININCNDIATQGVAPMGLMITILAPPKTTRDEIGKIMEEIQEECSSLNVTVLGGHTEITNAVNKIVISATSIGIGSKEKFLNKKEIIPGDRLLITKGIGIEGTGIIAHDKEKELKEILNQEELKEAMDFLNKTSVVKDGLIGGKYAKGMHDVTEGGLLGAIWESSRFYNLGSKIYLDKIKVAKSTKKICDYYKIDYLRLISSGTMLMVVSKENIDDLIEELKENNIDAFEIGELTEEKRNILVRDGKEEIVEEPESDELYKVV